MGRITCPWRVNASGKGMEEKWESGGYGGRVSGECCNRAHGMRGIR